MAKRQSIQLALIGVFACLSLLNLCYLFSLKPNAPFKPQAWLATMTSNLHGNDLAHAPEKFKLAVNKHAVRVPLTQDEHALMLQATLDNQQDSTFILDTGATYTSISPELAKQLGYDLKHAPKIIITTANGQVAMPKITLKSLSLNGYTAYNVEATVMPLPKHLAFSGLLGLSFIRHHRITIDSEAQQMMIEPQDG